MWIEKEPTENPKGKNKTKLEKWTVLDAGPNWNKSHDCPAKTKKCLNCRKIGHYARFGPKNKTYSTRIRSYKCRRKQLDTKQNTLNKQHGPFNETNIQRRTTNLYCDGIGQQPSNQIHNSQRITSHTHTKAKIQWNYNIIPAPLGIQRRKQQQNQI